MSLGTSTLTKDGVGRLTLAGVNVYSGATGVNNGTLRLANSAGLGSSSMTTVSGGATVELIGGVSVGNALTLVGAGISNLGALRSISGNNSWTGTLVVGSAATYINSDSGVLDITGVISGNTAARGVRYGGAGTVEVSGASTYTGVSEISTGATLLLGNSNVLSSSSNVLFSGGKLLSDGKSVSVGTLSVSSASELVLGTGSHTVRFSAGGTFSFTRLLIKGWEGVYSGSGSSGTAGQVFVGSSAVLTREQLDQIQFVDANNVSYYAVQLGTGEVVPGLGTLANPTGNSNIQVTTSATVGGSWSGLVSGTYTFTPSADNANINVVDITNRLRATGGIGTPGNVRIVTTNVGASLAVTTHGKFTSDNLTTYLNGFGKMVSSGTPALDRNGSMAYSTGGTQVGNVNFVNSVSVGNPYTARYSLQVVAGGDIVVSSPISLDGESWSTASNFGYDVDFSAVGNVLLNSSLSTSGQSAAASSQSVRSNGGNVVLSAGGYVKVGGSITASGGTNSSTGGTNSNGGNVSITGPGGVTMTSGITTLGVGGIAGVITINSGNGTVTSGGGVNDGQVSGLIQGGNFVKSGAGIFVIKGSNTYSGSTTISAGTLRLGAANSIPTGTGLTVTGTLDLGGFNQTVSSLSGAGLISSSGSGTLVLTVSSGSYSGVIENGTAGSVGLTKTSTSTLALSGSNTYTGPTLVNQGVLTIGHSNGLGVSVQTTVSDGAALWLQGGISIGALPLSLRGQGASGTGALRNISGNNSWAGTVTLVSATTRINSDSGSTLTLGGSSSISSSNIGLEVGGNGDVVVSG
ncbi:MAG: hypothetical protein EBS31_08175, partial [Burkholderiaceae bacterium]|nr:hypothetical protein [Burkholderiaceae bacterium]